MNPSQFDPVATAQIRWLRLEEGGRNQPPTGPIYAATAVFAQAEHDAAYGGGHGYATEDHVSILLKISEGGLSSQLARDAEIDFLARELVKECLVLGARLWIMEGIRPVAECQVVSIFT